MQLGIWCTYTLVPNWYQTRTWTPQPQPCLLNEALPCLICATTLSTWPASNSVTLRTPWDVGLICDWMVYCGIRDWHGTQPCNYRSWQKHKPGVQLLVTTLDMDNLHYTKYKCTFQNSSRFSESPPHTMKAQPVCVLQCSTNDKLCILVTAQLSHSNHLAMVT